MNTQTHIPLPTDNEEAARMLFSLVDAIDEGNLQTISKADFLSGWYSLFFLYPALHPDDCDDSESTPDASLLTASLGRIADMIAPFHGESGWPANFLPIVRRAWELYESGELADEEFYCTDAVLAGVKQTE